MGGFGSGDWNRRHRGTVEGYRRLDAVSLQKGGALARGATSTVSWSRGDESVANIRVEAEEGRVRLVYSWKDGDGAWRDVREHVPIDWSPRRLGGAQAYFRCPDCGARARFLIGAGPRFLCRACHGLVHASSRERPTDRAMRKVNKLRRRIGAEPGLHASIPPRPKGMHATTYEQIFDGILAAEAEVDDDMVRLLARLQKTTGRLPSERSFWS